mmetsp:Transcript_61689/g.156103  ORF Transcript_61689/g.156103 Transcript_61689/m.156103 type:complete len:288 (-) Transcript_61689:199-1062(-)|eukprot:CAMPEP_0115338256 /NCGR_PEP_ID=MMETSP0270-20121206/89973_1 /TAXON_ID=71861 /ORGANISM="Scrippsiella trochoidea, Strain CCMP3099" /LENGTH=287 /DNA_ID=CAMNT_0002759545 /DNA_START=72 /DNA_END=935 /DNA_ORIENTATION=-
MASNYVSAPPVGAHLQYAAPAGALAQPPTVMMHKLQAVLDRFEISIAEANDLVVLEDYDIVVIADDSGSMQNAAQPSHMRTSGAPIKTRWDELKETISEIIEIASCFNPAGIDVHFLNRPTLPQVKHANDARFHAAFASQPSGRTPLTETLQRVAGQVCTERGVLLFILTDGEPNGGKRPFSRTLKSLVSSMKLRIQIMACTGDDEEVEWLNDLDCELTELDVTDDYHTERAQVLRTGLAKRFTRGDWCMKAMLGPVSQKFDRWDEGGKRSVKADDCGPDCGVCSIM